ncbi:MAG: hypothetical protein WC260_02150 [Candidatus Pacearchaeota archaeon]
MPKEKNKINFEKSLLFGLSLVLIVLIFLNIINDFLLTSNPNLENLCSSFEGKWLKEYNECEGISLNSCQEMKGTFSECESACRHTNSEFCILICVPVCSFN